MIKLSALLIGATLISTHSYAETNPFFGDYKNQIQLNVGSGVDSGIIIPPPEPFVKYGMIQGKYAQPDTFFTLPGRYSVDVTGVIGYGTSGSWDWVKQSDVMGTFSEDIILYNTHNWYYGCGGSVGLQIKQNHRIASKFLLGAKVFAGYKLTERSHIEAFIQHYSDGNTSPENYSYGFYGVGYTYNF
jgi:hypothetical protein